MTWKNRPIPSIATLDKEHKEVMIYSALFYKKFKNVNGDLPLFAKSLLGSYDRIMFMALSLL